MKLKSDYIFLPSPELIRAAVIAVLVAVAQVAVTQDWTILDNWQTYAVALASAAVLALAQFILGKLPPATRISLKALLQSADSEGLDTRALAVVPKSSLFNPSTTIASVRPSDRPRRVTLCNFAVDDSDRLQRQDHTLREAPFCGKCIHDLLEDPDVPVTVAFTDTGYRRHFAHPVPTNTTAIPPTEY